jgi:hypothetical protein
MAKEREIRLAELVALLSLGTDLGLGQPMEHAMRQCLIALRLADKLKLGEQARGVLFMRGCSLGSGVTRTLMSKRSGSATRSR